MGLLGKVGLIILIVVVAGAGTAFYLGLLPPEENVEEPEVSAEDIGDWGEVSDNKIEVIHTLNVQNPNPVSAQVGKSTTLNLQLQMNDIRLGSVQKTGLDIQQGNNSVQVTSELKQNRLAEFWARFINQDETIHAQISPSLEVNAGPGFSVSASPIQVSALTNERPVSQALESAGNEMEGTYTKEVNSEDLSDKYLPDTRVDIAPSQKYTLNYTVENVKFEWGEVTAEQTKLLIHTRVRNTGENRQPGVPDRVGADILLNDVEVFHARSMESGSITTRNLGQDTVLRPGEVKNYTLVATADNQNIEEWFTTYAAQREQSRARVEFDLLFSLGDASISVPEGGAIAHECRFQTGIFVDNQSTATTCGGENGNTEIAPSIIGEETSTPTETPTDGPPSEENPDSGSKPTAQLEANPTQGEAPLDVDFDASESSDPDGDIQRYVWRFKDGSTPTESETVTHTFQTAGEYEVELTVTDSQGNTDTDTVTIDVEPESSEPPTAVAQAEPTSGEASLEVDFEASDSSDPDGEIQAYIWRFEDLSTPAEGEQVTHTFDSAGEYEVELTVVDNQGNTATDTVTIDVEPESSEPPTAVADATPTSGEASLEVKFDASGSSDPDGDIQRYVWRFKDGSTPAEGETVTHTFQTAGEYDVELVVFDSEGNQDSTTVTVNVESRIG